MLEVQTTSQIFKEISAPPLAEGSAARSQVVRKERSLRYYQVPLPHFADEETRLL